jgi:hypothetical protein
MLVHTADLCLRNCPRIDVELELWVVVVSLPIGTLTLWLGGQILMNNLMQQKSPAVRGCTSTLTPVRTMRERALEGLSSAVAVFGDRR